ncbi:MAG: FAD-dependent oxidoreductase, partial [Burkholderiales bacterium]
MKNIERSDERILSSDIFGVEIFDGERQRAGRQDLGTVQEPRRAVPVYRSCDVLVVGGGPSGTAAAVAAARYGAEVV